MNLKNLSKQQLIKMVDQKLAPHPDSLLFRGRSKTPSVASSRRSSRSRSKSRGKGGFRRRTIGGAAFRSGRARSQMVKSSTKKMMPLLEAKKQSDKKLALVKSGYFADQKDQKGPSLQDVQKDNDQLLKEIQLAVGAIRGGLGDRPIRMKLAVPFVITTTVTSGVTNTVTIGGASNALDPSLTAEWATVAALFEEYKVLGGEAVFNYNNPSAGSAANIFSIGANSTPTMAYDADDATSATGVNSLVQASQHVVFSSFASYGSTNGTSSCANVKIGLHRFRWHVPRGNVNQNGFTNGGAYTVTDLPGTEWNAIAGVLPVGWLKFYHVGREITAVNTGQGEIYFDCEFRCRA